jgi:hypothetical protein
MPAEDWGPLPHSVGLPVNYTLCYNLESWAFITPKNLTVFTEVKRACVCEFLCSNLDWDTESFCYFPHFFHILRNRPNIAI